MSRPSKKSNEDWDLPIFDIETGPLDFEDCKGFAPPEILLDEPAPWMLKEFRDKLPSNYKEETKDKKTQEWAFSYDAELEQSKYMNKAALDPTRGFVCWFGMKLGNGDYIHLQATEPAEEWELLREANELLAQGGIGLNSNRWDLPFMWMRCILHGIPPLNFRQGRYAKDEFIDLQEIWEQFKSRSEKMHPSNMDFISGVMGWPKKPGKATDFYGWLVNGDIEKCTEYSQHDLDTTEKLAFKLNVKTEKTK